VLIAGQEFQLDGSVRVPHDQIVEVFRHPDGSPPMPTIY